MHKASRPLRRSMSTVSINAHHLAWRAAAFRCHTKILPTDPRRARATESTPAQPGKRFVKATPASAASALPSGSIPCFISFQHVSARPCHPFCSITRRPASWRKQTGRAHRGRRRQEGAEGRSCDDAVSSRCTSISPSRLAVCGLSLSLSLSLCCGFLSTAPRDERTQSAQIYIM